MAENQDELVYFNTVTLRKDSKRSLTDDKIDEQIDTLIARISTPGRVSKGWRATAQKPVIEAVEKEGPKRARGNAPTEYVNRVILNIVCKPDKARAGIDGEFSNIVSLLVAASNSFPSWQVELVNGLEWADATAAGIKESGADDFVGYAPLSLPQNWNSWFSHLFDRDAQVEIAMSALIAAIESDWRNRFHTVMVGPPACGKTELLATIRRMCGNDAVMVIDCTATTQAGLTKELSEREELPRVIIAEELEKAEEGALRVLLGLLDTRGEIRKVTAREKISRECKVLMFATVNDFDRFSTLLSGALASRFAHTVYCPRPDRAVLTAILGREIEASGGNPKWIEPCIDYLLDVLKTTDARKAIALCLSGRDGWLTGRYVEQLEKVRRISVGFLEG